MKLRLILNTLLIIGITHSADARKNVGVNGGKQTNVNKGSKSAAACSPGAGRTDLDLNNVRALLHTAGDMWWDLNNSPRYEVPKGSNKHSAFASALWIGGVDNGGNLKVAAMTYRQTGNDFWPGPLKLEDASITSNICQAYDKHWKISRQEVEAFVLDGAPATEVIASWPGNGDFLNGFAKSLAPFIDLNDNGIYEPELGEYPGYDVTGDLKCEAKLFGDQTLWWVFNDKGNIHSETNGFPIGLEIRAQAFAFATNNALNNMTFYNYEIINRSTFDVINTYFGQWVDSDIGFYNDDFVGCDVQRGLGYTYNGDADDEGVNGYGLNPPAFGLDFFEGPFMDADSTDNPDNPCLEPKSYNGLGFGDGIIDNERIGMSKFVYYNNDFSIIGNPEDAQDVYNYLRGRWKDGTPMIYGGNGYGSGTLTNFMYPGDTDPLGVGQIIDGGNSTCLPQAPWDETTSGNTPADRRFLQSAGPFVLKAGAVNTITVGAVWAQTTNQDRLESVRLLRLVDDDAQALFDNCFSIINGPNAPQVRVVEMDREVILILENTQETVSYRDTTSIPGFGDVEYVFQGYLIYQLRDESVTVNDLRDASRARLIAQCDIRDSIDMVVNRYYDLELEENVARIEVRGANQGIRNSFRVTDDAFASGNSRLVNHKRYNFMVLAYSVSAGTPPEFNEPFLAGRRTQGSQVIERYTAIPHINSPEAGGRIVRAQYGEKPVMTRIEGFGNGGNFVDFEDETVANILQPPYYVNNPVYKRNSSPVDIRVVNPLNIPNGNFEFRLDGLTPQSRWTLKGVNTAGQEVIYNSFSSYGEGLEEVIPDFGLSVTALRVANPGEEPLNGNGFISASLTFGDNTKRWLSFLADEEGCDNAANWIRSGIATSTDDPTCNDFAGIDDEQDYEKVLGGTWAPYRLVSNANDGPAYSIDLGTTAQQQASLSKLQSVNIVITPDKNLWSRCPVFETTDDQAFAEGNARKGNLRNGPSLDKNGNPDGTGTGMSWFPGYAINVETGERLNIGFGESSRLGQDYGRDMIFNPSSRRFVQSGNSTINLMGGKHFIYVFGHNGNGPNDMPRYDEGQFIRTRLEGNPSSTNKRFVWRDCMWVGIPIAVPNQPFLTTDLTIRLRVNKRYERNYNASVAADAPVNDNLPLYTFNTADLATTNNDRSTAENALDLIRAVPNPYYAYSAYERNQIDNRIKITNLPKTATITIYNTNGMLVRRLQKDDPSTSIEWDLKNQSNISIASGIYIIHINAPDIGEKVIKWFGVLRPIDLDTF